MSDLDSIMFDKDKENTIMSETAVETVEKKKVVKPKKNKPGIGLDVGTGFLVGAGFEGAKVKYAPLRDAFFSIDKSTFNRSMFDKGSMKYVEINDQVHVIGEDALTLAKIRNTDSKRPLKSGVINPSERNAAPILKEMFRYCVKPFINKEGETLVFSVPGPKIGDEGFNV